VLSPTAPNELNYALPQLVMVHIQKTSRYFLSKQEGTVKANKPSHATVPLKSATAFFCLTFQAVLYICL
jgi:hypothetical protein